MTSSSVRNLQYCSLPKGAWTRLLKLLPGRDQEPIKCELLTVEVNDADGDLPAYEAVSYVWGDPTDTIGINVHGFVLPITRNLHGALERFRNDKPRILWADAICIDQSNIVERGHQVSQMAQIYEGAERVLVWLGREDTGAAEFAFDMIINFNRNYGPEYLGQLPNASLWWEFDASEEAQQSLGPSKLQSIHSLLEQEWFQRIWVLQEVGIARTAILHWGASILPFSELVNFCVCVGRSPNLRRFAESEEPYGQIINTLLRFWSGYGNPVSWRQETEQLKLMFERAEEIEGGRPPFSQVLFNHRNYKATDPRDHIYALLGHSAARDTNGQPLVEADYNRSITDLHLEVSVKILDIEKNLNHLSAVQHDREDLKTGGCTISWVPPLHLPRLQRTIAPKPGTLDRDASLTNGQETESGYHRFVAPNKLIVRVIIFDTIPSIGPVHSLSLEDVKPPTSTHRSTQPHPFDVAWAMILAHNAHQPTTTSDTDPLSALQTLSIVLVAGYLGSQTTSDPNFAEHWSYFGAHCAQVAKFFPLSKPDPQTTPEPVPPSEPATVLPTDPAAYEGISHPSFRAHQFAVFLQMMCDKRRFFITESGRYGLGPMAMREGDVCAVVVGGRVPFVLRPCDSAGSVGGGEGSGKTYRLVGECYVHGVMTGDVVREQRGGRGRVEEVVLV